MLKIKINFCKNQKKPTFVNNQNNKIMSGKKIYFDAIVLILLATTIFYSLRFNSQIPKNNFDQETFVPDTTYPTIFPWKDVMACFDKRLDAKKFTGHKKCPKCGKKSQDLIWIQFRSPSWTWKELVGREGPLSICPHCKIQVEFILQIMN